MTSPLGRHRMLEGVEKRAAEPGPSRLPLWLYTPATVWTSPAGACVTCMFNYAACTLLVEVANILQEQRGRNWHTGREL